MPDIFEIISEYSYLGIFFLLVAVNAAPLLMPPTWIILSSFYAIDPLLDPLILSLIGATGATISICIRERLELLWSSINKT